MSRRRVWGILARRIGILVCSAAMALFLLPIVAIVVLPFFQVRGSRIDGRTDRLHQLGQVLELYEENNGGRLPPMESASALRHAVQRYVKEPRGPECVFRDPHTHQLFLTNPHLSHRKVSAFDAASTVAISAPAPDGWGETVMLFLSGRVRYVAAGEHVAPDA